MFCIKRVYNNYLFISMQKEFVTGLKLRNSLSNSLVLNHSMFRKILPLWMGKTSNGTHVDLLCIQIVTWVMRGKIFKLPRNYLCNDMIRRVLRDHFGYNIQYCMNITDVDDKIINRSNE